VIFTFFGAGDYRFVAGINWLFQRLYTQLLQQQQVQQRGQEMNGRAIGISRQAIPERTAIARIPESGVLAPEWLVVMHQSREATVL